MYQAQRPFTSQYHPIRHLRYHVLSWGSPSSTRTPLVMLHGWMDVGASFQFVVDAFGEAFAQGRQIIAPDWRGYGLTETPLHDNFWFPDYLADLDFLLDAVAPNQSVDLLGHSMGGNVAMMYAGSRPERIRRLINLEGFGMPAGQPAQAPKRYAKWMDELKSLHRGELALASYDSAEGVARRLMKTNPRLQEDKAQWLAQHWARPNAQGRWEILGHAAHKVVNATLYQVPETLALYQSINAPLLAVEASHNQMEQWWQGRFSLAEYHERLEQVPQYKIAQISDAGHMLHHDQPLQLARLIEAFLA
jgi:pimeloyl-ACP methyl ester carboxylesterase